MSSKMEQKASGSVLIFGGTMEGRILSDHLVSDRITHTVCVATEYGEEVLEDSPYRKVHCGRLKTEEMCDLIREKRYCAVVDATHPYAVEVSKNIRNACRQENIPYLRYLRPQSVEQEAAGQRPDEIWVNSAKEAAEYLEQQTGVIFLTTGSKELNQFTEIISDKSRLFARVLPSAEVIDSCRALGLEGKQICGMQGPFTKEMNEAMLRQTKASFLVTKNTGTSGGFSEKLEAARSVGISSVIIRRPEEQGLGFEEVTRQLRELLDEHAQTKAMQSDDDCENSDLKETDAGQALCPYVPQTKISCVGIGMGTPGTLTQDALQVIRSADILFGAKRILESVSPLLEQKPLLVQEYSAEKIYHYLQEHPGYHKAAVLMSGDVGFYSGAKKIGEFFPEKSVEYFCGISSVVYFASRIPTSWQDAKLLSAHGKEIHFLNCVQRYPKIILLVSGAEDVERLCRELADAQMDQVTVTVGNNLSYPDETIASGTPADFTKCSTKGLHIMMVENPDASHVLTPGIPDEDFVRGKVPMTKEEIRILSVAKLRLTEDAVVYDVGAGTGSVSAECARLCTRGTVYAIERNHEGIELIRANSRKLRLSNLVPVEGVAPQAMEELPVPTHAFIGGSAGNMKEIIEMLLGKNPRVRIVINTITLESIAEVIQLLKELEAEDADIIQVTAARSKALGRYHLMTGQNPVYIISFGGR